MNCNSNIEQTRLVALVRHFGAERKSMAFTSVLNFRGVSDAIYTWSN